MTLKIIQKRFSLFLCASLIAPTLVRAASFESVHEALPIAPEIFPAMPVNELGTVPNYSDSLESPSPLLEEAAPQKAMKEIGTVPNSSGLHVSLVPGVLRGDAKEKGTVPNSRAASRQLQKISALPSLSAGNLFDGSGGFSRLSENPSESRDPSPKRDAMDEFLKKSGVPQERLPEIKEKIKNFWEVLSGHASALGGEDLEFRLGEWWMTRQKEGQKTVVFIPITEVLEHLDEPEVLAGAVTHEAGHVFETRWHKIPDFKEELEQSPYPQAVHTLNNVLEDMAQERSMKQRWPGTEKYLRDLHKSYRGDFFADPKMPLPENLKEKIASQDELKETLPHEEYIDALRKFWMTGKFPENSEIKNPAVREALNHTRQAVEEVLKTTAPGHSPSEDEKIRFQEKRLKLIREKILPEYLKLVDLSKKRLEEEMKEAQGDEQGQQSQGQGSGEGKSQEEKKEGSSTKESAGQEAQKTIEERAREIAKKLCPTDHNPQSENQGQQGSKSESSGAQSKGQGSISLDPSQWSEGEEGQTLAGQKMGEMERGDVPPPAQTTAASGNAKADPLQIAKELVENRDKIEAMSSPQNRYEEILEDVSRLVDILSGRLENIFSKNDRFNWDDRHFKSGPSVSIKRWIKSEARGWRNQDDFKVFKRKLLPTKRDYKFSLLIDVSGSMAGERMRYALQTAVTFMESLERLGIDFNLLGFAEKVYLYKNFSPNQTSPETLNVGEKNRLIEAVERAGGGATWDAEAVLTALKGDSQKGISGLYDQNGERRVLIVMTDGEGNGAGSNEMGEVLAEAKRQGVEVIGVGIGAGMAYVQKRYPRYILEPTMETAPQAIADVLEREVENGFLEENQ